MDSEKIVQRLQTIAAETRRRCPLALRPGLSVDLYPPSILALDGHRFFIGAQGIRKFLWIVAPSTDSPLSGEFQGEWLDSGGGIKRCAQTHGNAIALRCRFGFTRPVPIGLHSSFGLGDRLGLANPAHLRAIAGSGMKLILAQQSIRELERTQRTPDQVMDAASWAVFQEGYREGFGADADHLKTPEDIDLMIRAGFTMFTFDPSAYVVNEAAHLPAAEAAERAQRLPWDTLEDRLETFLARYVERPFHIADDFCIRPSREETLRALVKYGGAIAHAVRLCGHLDASYPDPNYEVELSVDETDTPTSPLEHFLIASELRRLGVRIISLAPRFIGDFEKGIDYKGDLEVFKREYRRHAQIAACLGPYKLSIHSGSDKFAVYRAVGSLRIGSVHVKTAGTSYLEALRTVAAMEPELFRDILRFARPLYEGERRSYHVSAELNRVPLPEDYPDARLQEFLDQDDARQVLHVTFGKVLTARDSVGDFLFRSRLLDCLTRHEAEHYDFVEKHIRRHLEPFKD